MGSFATIYLNLLCDYNPNLDTSNSDFVIAWYAYLDDGKCKKCETKFEAEQLSNHVSYVFDKEKYQKAFKQNQKIKTNAEQKIKQLMQECVGIIHKNFDNAAFQSAFELSKQQLDEEKFGKYLIYDMDKLYERTLLNYKVFTAYPFE